MMVLFTSRSEKKAILTVRSILDLFADRIGSDTWQTVITEEGLAVVKTLLRRAATKNMAVSCRWMHARHHSRILWIVGNRERFNEDGIVPVNATAKNLLHREWEGGWKYLPLIKALAAMAALLHDWGKASDYFQKKLLRREMKADPFRHEWISCKLIEALVTMSGKTDEDDAWLALMGSERFNENKFIKYVRNEGMESDKLSPDLPPFAQCLIWLILSHHRLPNLFRGDQGKVKYFTTGADTVSSLMQRIHADWSYAEGDVEKRGECFKFSKGLLLNQAKWRKDLKKWAARLLALKDDFMELWQSPAAETALRPVFVYAREALMLADHYVSSLPQKEAGDKSTLWANTDKKGDRKQTLPTHLLEAEKQALFIAHHLPAFVSDMEAIENLRFQPSKGSYAWQEKAVHAIRDLRAEENAAWFVVNMASTGCGKTTANAKIAQAISKDGKSLRYILALGLRTLTLQTGTEYRERIGLGADDFATLIGSKAVESLYEQAESAHKDEAEENERIADTEGAGSEELLLSEVVFEENSSKEQIAFLQQFFSDKRSAAKNRAFLYKPVLALTIDHIMGAVETVRGGHHLLPILRLLSSDIVIDEIDDFSADDLTAIARLVHLAGMMGRSVVISSATIPPDLAIGMERAYRDGLSCYNRFAAEPKKLFLAWTDEFRSTAARDDGEKSFAERHDAFVTKREKNLRSEEVQIKRKAAIVDVSDVARDEGKKGYFKKMRETAEKLHEAHHIVDKKTGKRISFGLIRIANIEPCVRCCQYLMEAEWSEHIRAYLMCYHSRQVLLLRHVQEKYLDAILKRKEETDPIVTITDRELRRCIDASDAEDIVFIVVATPVEEIGRDHDFDWAVVEPSSYRSLIQLAGRILRHRCLAGELRRPNIAVMQYNLKGFLDRAKKRVFCHPGYEESVALETHDMKELVDEKELGKRIDAVPRIKRGEVLNEKKSLIDLEHYAMEKWRSLEEKGPQSLAGWQQTFWWMTGLPQQMHRFRASDDGRIEKQRFYVYDGSPNAFSFQENARGKFVIREEVDHIKRYELSDKEAERLWLSRDYKTALYAVMEEGEMEEDERLRRASKRYGEITWREYENRENRYWYSDAFGLFEGTEEK